MNIAFITSYWKNSVVGGTGNYVMNLVEALREKGVEVDVLFREGKDSKEFQGSKGKIQFVISSYRRLCAIRPDVVHSHSAWFCLLPGVLYKKFHGSRLVYTFHTQPDKKMSFIKRQAFQWMLNSCDSVTFVSKGLQKSIVEILGLSFSRSAITYAGVHDRDVSEKEAREFMEEFKLVGKSPVLTALGLTALKYKAEGARVLMLALKNSTKKYPKIVLVITKKGRYSNELMEFAKTQGISEHVVFTGDIKNPFTALATCDIYTHISLGEGLPIALLEAMSMGKPIVATPVAGIPEAINNGQNGLLVEPDSQKIAEKIQYLLENPDVAKKLGQHAKKTAEERFTWDKSADMFIEIYGVQK